ncbi:receptor-like protein kinase ANXUR1 [Neltuma alba]|uniref:receptor-like protein kinase ANXUR1 n=1 Tax=Neltuma alba TaxID=207710 RepID=UPI0010A2BCE0|nr:receptor-like protein kinase ANXUR1 [Prosopis alba]
METTLGSTERGSSTFTVCVSYLLYVAYILVSLQHLQIHLRSCEATFLGMGILLNCFGGSASTSKKQPSTSVEYLCQRFSLAQLRKSTNGFSESHFLRQGQHGPVYRGSISINGQLKDITVKRLGAGSSTGLTLYKNDVLFMCQLHHPNLQPLVGFCDDKNEMIVVYEHAPNGSLRDLFGSKPPTFSWKKRLEISIGVARGLHYLHAGTKRIIIHRNIKSACILLGENWVPKLSYFGFSLAGPKFSAKDMKPLRLESVKGPKGHIAPECFGSSNVTYKCDVYSFGVVLLELICGKTLYQISELDGRQLENTADFFHFTLSLVEKVRNLAGTVRAEGIIDETLVGQIAAECSKLYLDIAESCLREDHNERPDMGDVEVQLERLLQLQEEADSSNASL